jgi:hypothetical protein
MKKSECFITSDNALFHSAQKAKEYAARRYDNAMSRLLSNLIEQADGRLGASEKMFLGGFIETHFSDIAELAALRADIELDPEDSGEE